MAEVRTVRQMRMNRSTACQSNMRGRGGQKSRPIRASRPPAPARTDYLPLWTEISKWQV